MVSTPLQLLLFALKYYNMNGGDWRFRFSALLPLLCYTLIGKMIQNCQECGRVIINGTLCAKCAESHQGQLKMIKDYLQQNPGATLFDITADLDINTRLVLQLVKSGEITLSGNRCESCGRSIPRGTVCESCKIKENKI